MIKHGGRMRWLVYTLFWLALATVTRAVEITPEPGNKPVTVGTTISSYNIRSTMGIDDFSSEITSCPVMKVYWDRSAAAAIRLYATQPGDDTLAEIEAAPTLATLTSDITLIIQPATMSVRWVIDTVETSSTVPSRLRIHCSSDQLSMGGVPFDADGNGRYEIARLMDADGDGSRVEVCTGKDTPDPYCNVAGEKFYRDFVDDSNCQIHGGCASGFQMEKTGKIYYEPGVAYIEWPCYDARKPSGYNDPTAANDNLHDDGPVPGPADTAYSHCAPTPDPGSTRRFVALALLDWQGSLIGAGTDTRNPATVSGYARTEGSYIINDMGPSWKTDSGYVEPQEGLNTWFGVPGFVRPFNIGFSAGMVSDLTLPQQAGEYAGDGGKGYGSVLTDQTIANFEDNVAQLCVTNTSGLNTLVAGDWVEVKSSSASGTGHTNSQTTLLRIRDVSPGVCGGTGIWLAIGGRAGYLGTNAAYFGTSSPHTTLFQNGMLVTAVRPDYFDSAAEITGFTFDSSDPWDSSDCSEVTTTSSGPYTNRLDADATNTDFDCDTNPMLGLFGAGRPRVHGNVFKRWHEYAIDGDSNAGTPLVENNRFMFGRGGPMADMGSGWRLRDFEIRDTQFASSGVSVYGPGLEIRGGRLYNTHGTQLVQMTELSVGNLIEDIRVENSGLQHILQFACGARRNFAKNLQYHNSVGLGGLQVSVAGAIASFDCASATPQVEGNVIDGWVYNGVQNAQNLAGDFSTAFEFNTNPTQATPNSDAIRGNVIANGVMRSTKATYDACIFAAMDKDTGAARGGNMNHEDVLERQVFYGNVVYSADQDLVYCGCNVNSGGGGGAGPATCSAIVGSGAGGGTPRGCMNIDGSVAGGKPANETCS